MNRTAALLALLLPATLLAGCSSSPANPPFAFPAAPDPTGRNAALWPHLNGTLTILDNGAAGNIDAQAAQFERLTGVHVVKENGGDAGKALEKLKGTHASGQYDVIYGLDNALIHRARAADVLEAYKPALAARVQAAYLESEFVAGPDSWYATPVDHGYIAINVDTHSAKLTGPSDSLTRIRAQADQLVVEDPGNSSPGLGFLLATVAKFGDRSDAGHAGSYDWHSYWADLFAGTDTDHDHDGQPDGCVLVAADWSEAYEQHFSGGYGDSIGAADKPIVVSYTESPAYEHFYGRPAGKLAAVLLEDNATWHQIQTMAVAKGTKHLAAAQAWIEFSLTDAFQGEAAGVGVYPVAAGIDVSPVYGGVDPAPGSFHPATIAPARLGANLERWLKEWTELKEAATNCRT